MNCALARCLHGGRLRQRPRDGMKCSWSEVDRRAQPRPPSHGREWWRRLRLRQPSCPLAHRIVQRTAELGVGRGTWSNVGAWARGHLRRHKKQDPKSKELIFIRSLTDMSRCLDGEVFSGIEVMASFILSLKL